MEGKIHVNRLDKSELQYELNWRGYNITDMQVKDMRQALSSLLKLENTGTSLTFPTYPYSFDADSTEIKGKILELRKLIDDFSESDTSGIFKKITSKLVHTFQRAERSISTKDGEHTSRSRFLVELLGLQKALKHKVSLHRRQTQNAAMPLDVSMILPRTSSPASSDSEDDDGANGPLNNTSFHRTGNNAQSTLVSHSVPVSKWNLSKFSGDGKYSLGAFLENVEELCTSRGVTQDQLFSSASEIFSGSALIWFRCIRHKVSTWPQLVDELRLQFQSVNFNEKLFEEIKHRTQGSNESIGIYIAVMCNMFNRLTVPVNEVTKLRIILQNITPFYQNQLSLVDVKSVDELLKLGRRIEASKITIDSYNPPPRNRGSLLEPDLAFMYTPSVSSISDQAEGRMGEVQAGIRRCWNCKSESHLSTSCDQPKKKYCYKCGKPDETKYTCPNCNKTNQGNCQKRRQ